MAVAGARCIGVAIRGDGPTVPIAGPRDQREIENRGPRCRARHPHGALGKHAADPFARLPRDPGDRGDRRGRMRVSEESGDAARRRPGRDFVWPQRVGRAQHAPVRHPRQRPDQPAVDEQRRAHPLPIGERDDRHHRQQRGAEPREPRPAQPAPQQQGARPCSPTANASIALPSARAGNARTSSSAPPPYHHASAPHQQQRSQCAFVTGDGVALSVGDECRGQRRERDHRRSKKRRVEEHALAHREAACGERDRRAHLQQQGERARERLVAAGTRSSTRQRLRAPTRRWSSADRRRTESRSSRK